jgi:hypothetical protein
MDSTTWNPRDDERCLSPAGEIRLAEPSGQLPLLDDQMDPAVRSPATAGASRQRHLEEGLDAGCMIARDGLRTIPDGPPTDGCT